MFARTNSHKGVTSDWWLASPPVRSSHWQPNLPDLQFPVQQPTPTTTSSSSAGQISLCANIKHSNSVSQTLTGKQCRNVIWINNDASMCHVRDVDAYISISITLLCELPSTSWVPLVRSFITDLAVQELSKHCFNHFVMFYASAHLQIVARVGRGVHWVV